MTRPNLYITGIERYKSEVNDIDEISTRIMRKNKKPTKLRKDI